MANEKGTRSGLRAWLNRVKGVTYTRWLKTSREQRLADYAAYQSGGAAPVK